MGKFQSEESAFNFAIEYLKSIKQSLDMCKLYSSRNDIANWYKWLRCVYREVSLKLTKDECKEVEKKFGEITIVVKDFIGQVKQSIC